MTLVLREYAKRAAEHVVGKTPLQDGELDDVVALLGFTSASIHGRAWGSVARDVCSEESWTCNAKDLEAVTERVEQMVTRSMELVYATTDREKVPQAYLKWFQSFARHISKAFFTIRVSDDTDDQRNFGLAVLAGLEKVAGAEGE